MQVRRIGYALGAEITGADLARPLDVSTIESIRQACVEHVVVVIRDQDLNAEQLESFGSRFGELDDNSRTPQRRYPGRDAILMLSNKPVTVNGKSSGGRGVAGLANSWHSDLSFTLRPSTMSFLVAKELPDVGGNTMFASMYAAYEALSPAYRAMIDGIDCVQDGTLTGTFLRAEPSVRAEIERINPKVVQPLVRAHPDTGRKALYPGTRIRNFTGMTEEETKPMLAFLNEHATRPEFIYRHRWSVNDFVMWDNRGAMHYAVPDFEPSQLRRMIRCSLVGPETGRLYEPDDARTAVTV